jgi:hypothetical protein
MIGVTVRGSIRSSAIELSCRRTSHCILLIAHSGARFAGFT